MQHWLAQVLEHLESVHDATHVERVLPYQNVHVEVNTAQADAALSRVIEDVLVLETTVFYLVLRSKDLGTAPLPVRWEQIGTDGLRKAGTTFIIKHGEEALQAMGVARSSAALLWGFDPFPPDGGAQPGMSRVYAKGAAAAVTTYDQFAKGFHDVKRGRVVFPDVVQIAMETEFTSLLPVPIGFNLVSCVVPALCLLPLAGQWAWVRQIMKALRCDPLSLARAFSNNRRT